MDGRLPLERINGPFHYEHKASPAEYGADLKRAIEKGWLTKHGCTRAARICTQVPLSANNRSRGLVRLPHRRVEAAFAGPVGDST
jgi:RNase P/RNase MRP subunit POP5